MRAQSAPRTCFNPRVREGRDPFSRCSSALREGFNPRVREGRDIGRRVLQCCQVVSIHASVKDATRHCDLGRRHRGFNPRVREGRDGECRGDYICNHVSIHASVKDATFEDYDRLRDEEFQSTRP